MHRRSFVAAVAAFGLAPRPAGAQADPLAGLLAELEAEPSLVENSWAFRTHDVSRGVGSGRRSDRPISARATDMIVQFEVISQRRYEALYSRPIWPKGQSGVTIGIGYDLRYANRGALTRDWGRLLDAGSLDRLASVLRLRGEAARDALPRVREVVVPWAPADRQFRDFLPYVVAQTETAFPNTGLLSGDSFGALVSLVYNRGAGVRAQDGSRAEMLAIQTLMANREFAAVPGQIRKMKRLWSVETARGLHIRRDAEALLFENGLA